MASPFPSLQSCNIKLVFSETEKGEYLTLDTTVEMRETNLPGKCQHQQQQYQHSIISPPTIIIIIITSNHHHHQQHPVNITIDLQTQRLFTQFYELGH